MGRPPLPIGTAGSITVTQVGEGRFRARCRFRDRDGVTRPVERHGKSRQAARSALNEHLKDRKRHGPTDGITPETTLTDVGKQWLAAFKLLADAGKKSPGTAQRYGEHFNRVIVPEVGRLRVREINVPILDRLLSDVTTNRGPGAARNVRAVLNGIMGLAVRHGAADFNPVRDVAEIPDEGPPPPRALTLEEVATVRGKLIADPNAVAKDLPDFVDTMLATGVRIGEVCAITWDSLDLDEGTVEICGIVIRVTGVGLIIKEHQSSKLKHRRLRLPTWEVNKLRLRKAVSEPNPWDVVYVAPRGGLCDPSNVQKEIRLALHPEIRDESGVVVWPSFEWITSHNFRKTVGTLMDMAGLPARSAADQLGHSKVSMTQDRYFGRGLTDTGAAEVLELIAPPERVRKAPR